MQKETVAEIAKIAAVEALKRHNELMIEEFDARVLQQQRFWQSRQH